MIESSGSGKRPAALASRRTLSLASPRAFNSGFRWRTSLTKESSAGSLASAAFSPKRLSSKQAGTKTATTARSRRRRARQPTFEPQGADCNGLGMGNGWPMQRRSHAERLIIFGQAQWPCANPARSCSRAKFLRRQGRWPESLAGEARLLGRSRRFVLPTVVLLDQRARPCASHQNQSAPLRIGPNCRSPLAAPRSPPRQVAADVLDAFALHAVKTAKCDSEMRATSQELRCVHGARKHRAHSD
jgi:hypothetical protein